MRDSHPPFGWPAAVFRVPLPAPYQPVPEIFPGSPSGSVVKNLPAIGGDAKDPGRIPGLGNPLEKEMAAHSRILAWEISWQRSPVGCSPWGRKESDTTKRLSTHMSMSLHELRLFQVGSFAQQLLPLMG